METPKEAADYSAILRIKPQQTPVSVCQSVDTLAGEYRNSSIIEALNILKAHYKYYRSIRGDGNCFIRAAAFSYIV